MNVAYVCGPYGASTHWSIVCNIHRAKEIGVYLWRQGWAVIVPHANTACFDGAVYPDDPLRDRQTWLRGDLAFIARLIPGRDVLVTVPGWERSQGSLQEVAVATNAMVSVFHWPEDEQHLERLAHPLVLPEPSTAPDD